MSVQKYQINDRVKRPNKNVNFIDPRKRRDLLKEKGIADCRYGTITEVELKADSRKRFSYFYYVKWDDSKRVALHSQNTLKPMEEN